ncbi:hypothetical protein [Pseudomonas sp.]|uniref:hypothetical protein n=1 Tax=Pseudomonas sp. TaxID=306 RepID=UPI00286BFA56|nr:hypothetical protein [Pseudomonas sp.]
MDEAQQSINERLSKPTEDAQQDEAQKSSLRLASQLAGGVFEMLSRKRPSLNDRYWLWIQPVDATQLNSV